MVKILRANQASTRVISFEKGRNNGEFQVTSLDEGNYKESVHVGSGNIQIIDCVFFPSVFGEAVALGMSDGTLQFMRRDDDTLNYEEIPIDENGTHQIFTSGDDLIFSRNLRISTFPPELYISYISKSGRIQLFQAEMTNTIKLVLINDYSPPNNLSEFIWFDFADSTSFWASTKKQILKYAINGQNTFSQSSFTYNADFVDASISPVKFGGCDRIAVLLSNNNINIYSLDNKEKYHTIVPKIKNPLSVQWSPFGSRLAVCSEKEHEIYIESSYNNWSDVKLNVE